MEALLAAGADALVVNDVHYPAERRGENFMAEEGEISLLMASVGMGHRRLRVSWGTPERRAGQTGQDQESLILDTVTVAVRAGVDLNASDAADQTALAKLSLDVAFGQPTHSVAEQHQFLDTCRIEVFALGI